MDNINLFNRDCLPFKTNPEYARSGRKNSILIYTEETPTQKVLNLSSTKCSFGSTTDFRNRDEAEKWSPMAIGIFSFPYVSGVYICNNFVSVTKDPIYSWKDITHELKGYIKITS